ncbi:MAB_1171c family putative transporter [Sciscionella marina]|uniref:MAB_1171c family putative transporter n=1 Tax=Sciscionella marina TaxID=508770 RepID=UPI0003675CE2|nr:MAB_1171c family putative transporter [Sciscionella marina]
MSVPSIVFVAVSWIGFIWLGIRWLGNPRNRILGIFVAIFFVAAVGSATAQISPRWQSMVLMAVVFGAVVGFALAARDNARNYLLPQSGLFLVAIVLVIVLPTTTPADMPGLPKAVHDPLAPRAYSAIGCVFAIWEAARLARRTARVQTIGIAIAIAGLALLVVDDVALCVVRVFMQTGVYPASLARVADFGQSVSGTIFVLGLLVIGLVIVARKVRYWHHCRSSYRALEPLWQLLHRAFPSTHDWRSAPSSRWMQILPAGAHLAYTRRVVECFDGLVRISPHIENADEFDDADFDRRAQQLVSAAEHAEADGSHPVGPALLRGQSWADAVHEMVEISRALQRQPSNTSHRADQPA